MLGKESYMASRINIINILYKLMQEASAQINSTDMLDAAVKRRL